MTLEGMRMITKGLPKKKIVYTRMTERDLEKLDRYCDILQVSRSTFFRMLFIAYADRLYKSYMSNNVI